MRDEVKALIADFFTAAELMEYMERSALVTVEDVIDVYEEELDEIADDIAEFIGVRASAEEQGSLFDRLLEE